MATVLRPGERDFKEVPGKIDNFRVFSDMSRINKGIDPKNLNFDVRRLDPGQFSSVYHFHRYAEEMFVMISGTATLRTMNGLETVESGDIIFCEMGEAGAHQLYNHTSEPCVYLDIRSYIEYDVCEYPDSNKLLIAPTMEIFDRDAQLGYFEGEENIRDIWRKIEDK